MSVNLDPIVARAASQLTEVLKPEIDKYVAEYAETVAEIRVRERLADVVRLIRSGVGEPPAPDPEVTVVAPKAQARPKPNGNGRSKRASLGDQIVAYLVQNPGARTEQIRAAIRGDVKKELRKLRAAGAVKKEGEKRASAYRVVG